MRQRPTALMIFGTRPDAIKMAPVVKAFQRRPDQVDTVIAVTGQHGEQLEQVLQTFGIKPDYDLAIMQPGQSLASITSRALSGLDEVFRKEQPSIALAQGDTTTTFAASLASFYHKVPFGHVEAGLRTDNRYEPFPEEINRRLTAVLADLHFAPTPQARRRLLQEGIPEDRVFLTGNTVIDALLDVAGRPYHFEDPAISALQGQRVLLVTLHRRENWGEPIRQVCQAIKMVLEQFPDLSVVFPMHSNPEVRRVVTAELHEASRVFLLDQQPYVPLVHLLRLCTLVLTDSGGIQEEAPSLGKPVLVARDTTERPEGVEAGSARLVGTNRDTIVHCIRELLTCPETYERMAMARNPYGDGKSAERICTHTLEYIQKVLEVGC